MTDEKTRALITDLREYATALRASVHVHHTGADLIEQAADTISALTVPDGDVRDGRLSKKIAALEEKHQPILVWSGGAVPEPSHEVCSECGDGDCTFFSELLEILAAFPVLSRAAAPEPEWEWGVQATVNIDGSPNARIELATEKELPHLRDSQRRGWCNLHRRRKAGPWELLPVGGETDGD